MTFLALCKRLRQEAGLSGTGPAAVTSQVGEMKRVVDWITAAYEDIQNAHATWRFLRSTFSFSTIAGTQDYTPAAAGITDFAEWIADDMRIYSSAADESFLEYYPWRDFRVSFLVGSQRTAQNRPSVVTRKPNRSIALYQVPDAVYTVLGEYFKTPQTMTADGDSPNFPSRFHMILVWRALMFYGAYAAANEKYAHGKNEYKLLKAQLELDQLSDLTYGAPLA